MRPVTVLTSLLLAASALTPASGQTMATAMANAAPSVAHVTGVQCSGSANRVGSGFLWRDNRTVVTARHVVAGCQRVIVAFTQVSGVTYLAVPDRELRGQDLVSMRLDKAATGAPLAVASNVPPVNTELAALGHAYGLPIVDSKTVRVTLANDGQGARLETLLDTTLRARVKNSGEIDVATNILRLDGNLLPGLSGSPVIGVDGAVYGIGSGGLQEGAGGVVWAVRAAYLADLATAPAVTSLAALTQASGLAFAFQAEQTTAAKATCGGLVFERARSATLEELYRGSDDPLGMQQLLATFGPVSDELTKTVFEIWVDRISGASIAVPAGSPLSSTSQSCTANLGSGVTLTVGGGQTAGPPAVQAASQSFELLTGANLPQPLMTDPAFSYLQPRFRADGFTVRRANYFNNRPGAQMSEVRNNSLFISHLARGGSYVGVAAVRRDFAVIVDPTQQYQQYQRCTANPSLAECVALRNNAVAWGRGVLATHLSTIPSI